MSRPALKRGKTVSLHAGGAAPMMPVMDARPTCKALRPARRGPVVLLLAATLSVGSCGGGGGDPDPAEAPPGAAPTPAETATAAGATCGLPDFAAHALLRINAVRAAGASCGSRGAFAATGALAWHAALHEAAAAHSVDMATRNYVSHTSPEGTGPGQRIAAAGYDARAWAENIAAGHPGVDAVVAGWVASDGHCANLMNPNLRELGLACVRGSGTTYSTYWTLKLAAPR